MWYFIWWDLIGTTVGWYWSRRDAKLWIDTGWLMLMLMSLVTIATLQPSWMSMLGFKNTVLMVKQRCPQHPKYKGIMLANEEVKSQIAPLVAIIYPAWVGATLTWGLVFFGSNKGINMKNCGFNPWKILISTDSTIKTQGLKQQKMWSTCQVCYKVWWCLWLPKCGKIMNQSQIAWLFACPLTMRCPLIWLILPSNNGDHRTHSVELNQVGMRWVTFHAFSIWFYKRKSFIQPVQNEFPPIRFCLQLALGLLQLCLHQQQVMEGGSDTTKMGMCSP